METTRDRSVLEALREPAAILDPEGRVLATNARFIAFAGDGALAGERFAPGSDFLQTSVHTRDTDGRIGELVQGTRDVLAGRTSTYTYEYACGIPPHSFELVVTAYHGDALDGALVVHYDVARSKQAEDARQSHQERLEYVSSLTPDGYWDWDISSGYCYYSPRWCESLGYHKDELPDRIETWLDMIHPDDAARVDAALQDYFERRTGIYVVEYRPRQKDGTYRWSQDRGRVLSWDADGKPLRMVGIDINIHERKIGELTIREQARRLMELSTPLIPINDDVVVMPLIGLIDANRAQQIMSSLLDGLSQRKAKVAILDITGVSEMDTHVASVLVNVATAVKLLGAQIVLTGIRPEVATILVRFDINWGNLVVRSTLQSGIAYATGEGRR